MTEIAEILKSQLLQLPIDDRAELAYCLIDSLDEKEGGEVSSAFEVELDRRWQEMQSGVVVGVSADDAFAEKRKKYP